LLCSSWLPFSDSSSSVVSTGFTGDELLSSVDDADRLRGEESPGTLKAESVEEAIMGYPLELERVDDVLLALGGRLWSVDNDNEPESAIEDTDDTEPVESLRWLDALSVSQSPKSEKLLDMGVRGSATIERPSVGVGTGVKAPGERLVDVNAGARLEEDDASESPVADAASDEASSLGMSPSVPLK
jgi:hypothetical protein